MLNVEQFSKNIGSITDMDFTFLKQSGVHTVVSVSDTVRYLSLGANIPSGVGSFYY